VNEPHPAPAALELPRLAPRASESHKGSYGTALIVGGSRGMSGAVALAGMAALRGGAGLVRLAVPSVVLDTVATFEPSYMTIPLPSDRAGRISADARDRILAAAESATLIALGPGLGRSPGLGLLTSWLYEHLDKPMVVDADGLNALAGRPDSLTRPGGPRILTPHPGEFDRLAGRRLSPDERRTLAIELATRWKAVVVLKGHGTCVTDGQHCSINPTGNPGMATGGSGDVLTGLVTALACQGLSPLDAARLGVYLHGLAGDLAAAELGQVSLIASDLVRFLPQAFVSHARRPWRTGLPC
jgi:NAD(P)H-hydrate epimerase